MLPFFDCWPVFSRDFRAAAHRLLLADYDGTLTPIAGRPGDARLSPEVRAKLGELAATGCAVGIVSGRAIAELQRLVGIGGIFYAGNHGLEIEGPGLSYINPEGAASRELIGELAQSLTAEMGGIPGIVIEDKGPSLSVHYRLVAEAEQPRAAALFRQITAPAREEGKIRLTSGKKVWEVRPPVDWHKGKAVTVILEKIKESGRRGSSCTVYLGDDATDEDAFRALPRPGGWGILVGGYSPSSAAGYYLGSPAEVAGLLDRLRGLLGGILARAGKDRQK